MDWINYKNGAEKQKEEKRKKEEQERAVSSRGLMMQNKL